MRYRTTDKEYIDLMPVFEARQGIVNAGKCVTDLMNTIIRLHRENHRLKKQLEAQKKRANSGRK